MSSDFDIFVIGGGINGCGIARDATGRGYSVCLAEMNDLASGTSSGSTKLIHGGLRYLEHYEFRLVREALIEREVLLNMAPHIIWPMRFVLPHHSGIRPAWLIRLGLFLYDNLGGRKILPHTKVLNLKTDEAGVPIQDQFTKAFEYSDCWVNDARFVVLNARDAADRGAEIHTRTKVVSARREGAHWSIDMLHSNGDVSTVTSRVLINAGGPWVDDILNLTIAQKDAHNIRLVQGSHIVVKKKFTHERAYFFQNADERIFFAIPYEQEYTLIGTTDQDHKGSPSDVVITDAEIDYLCEGASSYFKEPVRRDDIVWSYSAVRPLYDDGASKAQEATRDYVLRVDGDDDEPKVINIFGGKITTYRKLAESMLEKIGEAIGIKGAPWTEKSVLPGGDFDATKFEDFLSDVREKYPFLEQAQSERMARAYGTKIYNILNEAQKPSDLGEDFGEGLTEAEVRYQMEFEWVCDIEDILWRRTKLGIRLSDAQVNKLKQWMENK